MKFSSNWMYEVPLPYCKYGISHRYTVLLAPHQENFKYWTLINSKAKGLHKMTFALEPLKTF